MREVTKALLKYGENTNKCIMLGLIDPNGYERDNRVYYGMGSCPTISAREWKDPLKILIIKKYEKQ